MASGRKGESDGIWKIPLPRRLTYGQCIALKQGIVPHLSDEGNPPMVQITIKEGDNDGFYVTGTREQADRVANTLSMRMKNYYQSGIEFRVEGKVEKPETPMDEGTLELLEEVRGAIEEAVQRDYLFAMQNLNEQIRVREEENRQLKDEIEVLKEERLRPNNVYRAFTEEVVGMNEEAVLNFNILFDGTEDLDKAVNAVLEAEQTPEDYAFKKASEYAEKNGMLAWDELLEMDELPPFDEVGKAPCSPDEYKSSKASREYLLTAISNAPDEETRELLRKNLDRELERRQEIIDGYEEAETEYNRQAREAKGLRRVYQEAVAEQEKRRKDIDFETREHLRGAVLNLYMVRGGENITVTTCRGDSYIFNREMKRYILSAARGLTQKQVSERIDMLECIFYHDTKPPEQVQMELYNNLCREKGDTPFGKLGMDIRVYMLPDRISA